MPTYSALFKIDQPAGSGPGSPGLAHLTLWLGTRVNLTPTQPPPAAQYEWKMTAPKGSTADFRDPITGLVNARCPTPYFVPDVWGSYLVQLTINNGLYTCQLVAAIKFDQNGVLMKFGWRYPALQESLTAASDEAGWKQAIEDIFDSIYGVLSSLEEHGGQSGGDGSEARAADPMLQAERRLRLHEYDQTVHMRIGDSNYTYQISQIIDQKRCEERYLSLIAYTAVSGDRRQLTPEVLYGIAISDGPSESISRIGAISSMMGSYYVPSIPYSMAVYGTLLAISLDTAVVVFDLATSTLLPTADIRSVPMQIIVSPETGGGGFGRDCRMAFGIDQGVPRIYLTDKRSNKVYSSRVQLPITFTAASTQYVGRATADVVWTGSNTDAPHGIVVDDAGNVWVALTGSNVLAKFTVTPVDIDYVQLTWKKSYIVAAHPTELLFDGAYVVALHSQWASGLPAPELSSRCSWVATASGMQQSTMLQVCTPDETLMPLPVVYGPDSIAFDGHHIWLSCNPTLSTHNVAFACALPVRFSPSDGSCMPGWPYQEFANKVYDYLGTPSSIVLTAQGITGDGCGGVYVAFQLLEDAATVQHMLRTLPAIITMETDTLAVRGAAGVLVAASVAAFSGFSTQVVGAGAVRGLLGSNANDTVVWDAVNLDWKVGPGGSGGGSVNSVTGTEPVEVSGTSADPVIGFSPTPRFEAVTIGAAVGEFTLSSAPLALGGIDYTYLNSTHTGALGVVSVTPAVTYAITIAEPFVMPNADGVTGWSVALFTSADSAQHCTVYFKSTDFVDEAALAAWLQTNVYSGGAAPTVQLFTAAYTAAGPADYVWQSPGTVVTGFPTPTFTYALPDYTVIDEVGADFRVPVTVDASATMGASSADAIEFLGQLLVRTVTDEQMLSTTGALSEIVFNTVDSRIYQCVALSKYTTVWAPLQTAVVQCVAATLLDVGNVVGLTYTVDGTAQVVLTDIAQAGNSATASPYLYGVVVGCISQDPDPTYSVYVAIGGRLILRDGAFTVAPSTTDIGSPFYAAADIGQMSIVPPTGPNQWVAAGGTLANYVDGYVTVDINPKPPVWLETDVDWTDETLCADFSVGAQVVQTADPLWTTVGARFMVLVPGQPYYFKAVLAANDATSVAQIRWFANGVVIAGPAPAVTGTTVTSVQTTPAVVVGAGPMLIEAQVTLETAADPSTSRAICYSSTIVAYGEVLA